MRVSRPKGLISVMKPQLLVMLVVLVWALSSTLPAVAADNQSKVPPELRVGDGYTRVLETTGRGIQTYDCVSSAWKFREPTAAIYDIASGEITALHYVGPTWQSTVDGSKVVAAVDARLDAPNPQKDIQWLRLQATSNTGPGVFANVKFVQRLNTAGGVAPAGACTTGQSVSVPYKATYAFWAPTQ